MATLKISSDLQNIIKKVVLDTYFPVGSLYLTVGSENPNNTIRADYITFNIASSGFTANTSVGIKLDNLVMIFNT